MFTGIIESLGRVEKAQMDEGNLTLTMSCEFTSDLQIDQSIAHNGVCLTVTAINGDQYEVQAIQETLDKTNIGDLKQGDKVNLERCMKLGDRLDGHIVQGHVDTTGTCVEIIESEGSWEFVFEYANTPYFTVSKGSITVNGTSLTVVQSERNKFSVCIIPYTYEHTNFHQFKVGSKINLEFDIIGKYLEQYAKNYVK
ncbi:riboflavin synthase [bacterium]|jgi:riboflavin synthase|nr:riboflavin synthase [bacterium]